MKLSIHATRRIDWDAIQDATVGLTRRGSPARGDGPSETQIEELFETARREFRRALVSLQALVQRLLVAAGACAIGALGGLILSFAFHAATGAAVTTSSILGLLVVFQRIYVLGRDQAMLELVPIRYQLALQVAETRTHRRQILNAFLAETASRSLTSGLDAE